MKNYCNFEIYTVLSIKPGNIWTDITQSLKECEHRNFTKRCQRERVALLQRKFKEKEYKEIRVTPDSPWETLLVT